MEQQKGRGAAVTRSTTPSSITHGWDRRCVQVGKLYFLTVRRVSRKFTASPLFCVQLSIDRKTVESYSCTDEKDVRALGPTTCKFPWLPPQPQQPSVLLLRLAFGTFASPSHYARVAFCTLRCFNFFSFVPLVRTRRAHVFVSHINQQVMAETESMAVGEAGRKVDHPAAMPDVHSTHEFHQWYTELDARKKLEWDERFRWVYLTCFLVENRFVPRGVLFHRDAPLLSFLDTGAGVTPKCSNIT